MCARPGGCGVDQTIPRRHSAVMSEAKAGSPQVARLTKDLVEKNNAAAEADAPTAAGVAPEARGGGGSGGSGGGGGGGSGGMSGGGGENGGGGRGRSESQASSRSTDTTSDVSSVVSEPARLSDDAVLDALEPLFFEAASEARVARHTLLRLASATPAPDASPVAALLAEYERALEVVNSRLAERVMSNYSLFVSGMSKIHELGQDLQQSAVMWCVRACGMPLFRFLLVAVVRRPLSAARDALACLTRDSCFVFLLLLARYKHTIASIYKSVLVLCFCVL